MIIFKKWFIVLLSIAVIFVLYFIITHFISQNEYNLREGLPAGDEIEGWNTYSDEELGISFSYPSDWGNVSSNILEKGTCDVNNIINDPCSSIGLKFSNFNEIKFIMTSSLFIDSPNPRGGSLLDIEYSKGRDGSHFLCLEERGECYFYENNNNVEILKFTLKQDEVSEIGVQRAGLYYFIKSHSEIFPKVTVYFSELNNNFSDRLINSIKFID